MLADPVNRHDWTALEWSYYRLTRGYYTIRDVNNITNFFRWGF